MKIITKILAILLSTTNPIRTNEIKEKTADSGVTIDNCLIKNGKAADSDKVDNKEPSAANGLATLDASLKLVEELDAAKIISGDLAAARMSLYALLRNGSTILTSDWDIGDTRKILGDEIRARDGAGLKLYDDNDNGIFVKDGGNVGIGTTSPGNVLHLWDDIGTGADNLDILRLHRYASDKVTDQSIGLSFYLQDSNNNPSAGYHSSIKTIIKNGATPTGEKQGNLVFSVVDDATVTDAMYIKYDGNIGIGATPENVTRCVVRTPDAQSTIYVALVGKTLSDAATNFGTYGEATGGGGTNNYGVFGYAANATTNHHFHDNSGNYSDATGWHDVSDPNTKTEIRALTQDDISYFYNLLDKIEVKGYKYKSELKDRENETPERFGMMANELPDFLTGKDKKGISAGRMIAYLIPIVQHQKKEIEALKQLLLKHENKNN